MINIFTTWLNQQPRWQSFKKLWDNANDKKKKWNALVHLSNGLANMTFPFSIRHHKTGEWLRWEAAYDEYSREANKLYSEGQDSFKNWKVFIWRQLWHLLGGFIVGLSNLPLMTFFLIILVLALPMLPYGVPGSIVAVIASIWGLILTPYLIIAAVGVIIGYKEFVHDKSKNPYKNYIDTVVWMLGSALWLIIL